MTGKINRKILRLSIPAIVSNITVPALGIFDTAISGHLDSEIYLAAIAVGSVMLNIIFWSFGFLRTGTTGLTAVALGKDDFNSIRVVFSRSLFLAVLIGIILIIFQRPVLSFLALLINVDSNIKNEVFSYFQYRIWGSPALLVTMAISGWFIGMQSTVYPLIISVAMNVVNIIVSYLLVYNVDLGFIGIALGTTISNWFGLILSFFCVTIFLNNKSIIISFKNIFVGKGWGKYFTVNSNLFIRSLCIICVTTGITVAGSQLGITALAANVIIMQFFLFFSFFMDGFAFSGEALIGLYLGERNEEYLRLSYRNLIIWTLSISLIFTLIYGFFYPELSGFITDSQLVKEELISLRLYISLLPIISAWAFIYDGFYVGLTNTKIMMVSTLIGSILFFIITFFTFEGGKLIYKVGSNETLWIAFLVYLGTRGLFMALLFPNTLRRSFQKMKYTLTT